MPGGLSYRDIRRIAEEAFMGDNDEIADTRINALRGTTPRGRAPVLLDMEGRELRTLPIPHHRGAVMAAQYRYLDYAIRVTIAAVDRSLTPERDEDTGQSRPPRRGWLLFFPFWTQADMIEEAWPQVKTLGAAYVKGIVDGQVQELPLPEKTSDADVGFVADTGPEKPPYVRELPGTDL